MPEDEPDRVISVKVVGGGLINCHAEWIAGSVLYEYSPAGCHPKQQKRWERRSLKRLAEPGNHRHVRSKANAPIRVNRKPWRRTLNLAKSCCFG